MTSKGSALPKKFSRKRYDLIILALRHRRKRVMAYPKIKEIDETIQMLEQQKKLVWG